MRLFLEPTEPLLFRTGRPFNAGEGGYAESLFPPTPETIQGAIRAAIAIYWGKAVAEEKTLDEVFQDQQLVNLIGDHSGYGRFRIIGLTLGKRDDNWNVQRLLPAPAHLLEDENKIILQLTPQKMDDVQSVIYQKIDNAYEAVPYKMQYLLPDPTKTTKGKLEPVNGWLAEQSLAKVLTGKDLTHDEIIEPHHIYVREPRVGIGMQNTTKTTEEGLLYSMHMMRMQPCYGFVVDIRLSREEQTTTSDDQYFEEDFYTQSTLKLPKDGNGWLILGGERRAARFRVVETQDSSLEKMHTGKLLYLATPAYFEQGWQPSEWPKPLSNPVAAAINRYQPIGGWLLNPGNRGGQNKRMRRCVPAGSVYFFPQSVTLKQPLTNYGSEIGYGITYIGG